MADSSIGGVAVDFVANFARFREDVTTITKSVRDASGQMAESFKAVKDAINLVEGAMASLGVGLSIKGLVDLVAETIKATAEIKDQADAAGVTTQAFQALQYAASQTGTSQEQLTTGLTHMTRVLGQAADGSKQAQAAFTNIGVSIRDANGNLKSSQTIFRDVAEAISRIPSQAQRAAIEVALFGKSGQQLGPMFEEGAAGVDHFAAQAENLGLVFDQNMIVQAQKAQAAIEGLTRQWNAFLDLLVAKFTPQIMEAIKWLAEMLHLGEDTRMSDAIADANDLLKKTNDFLDQEHAKLQQIAGDWAQTGIITDQMQAEQLKAENAIIEAMKIRQRLQGNLDEMGERHRDPSLKKDVFAGGSTTTTGAGGAGGLQKASVDQATKDFEKQAAAIASVEQALIRETAQATMNSDEIRLDNALRQANVGIRTEAGQRIAGEVDARNKAVAAMTAENKLQQDAKTLTEALLSPQEKYNELLDEYNKMLAEGLISSKQYDAAVAAAAKTVQEADPAYKAAIDQQKELQAAVVDAGGAILNDLGRAFTDSGTAADRWKNLVSHAIQDVTGVLDSLLKKVLGGALDSLFGAAGGATLGSIFGFGGGSAILGPLAGSPMVTTLASGGSMGVGDWAIIGEQGPELVYADTPGNVMSADRTRGIFGQGPSNGGNTAYIDARGADLGAVARIEKGLHDLHYSIEHRAVAAVSAQRKRGGTFAATFNR